MTPSSMTILERLLRAPEKVAAQCLANEDPKPLFLAALTATLFGAATFGAVLATSRGGLQLAYSAAKVPLALLMTLSLLVSCLYALSRAFGRPLSFSATALLLLTATARASLVLLALSPVVWLAFDRGLAYHPGVLLAAGCYGLAGLSALRLLCHGLGADLRALVIIGSFGLVLLPTAGQTAWLMRPFLGRPAEAHVPFFRQRDSSFADAVYKSGFSSLGIYSRSQGVKETSRDAD
jgi:hypothetical protein